MGDRPADAPEHCPGTASEQAGSADACQGCPNQAACATAPKGPDPDMAQIAERMAVIKHKILVLSGKGGVGKSTVAAQLAFGLAAAGKEVGLLDIDICGPSAPKMFGLEGREVHQSGAGWSPVYVEDNLAVMSIGFLLPNPDDAVIWRGPRKNALIKQFLRDVDWGRLDYLVVDAPPGTSDEHISIAQLLLQAGAAAGEEGPAAAAAAAGFGAGGRDGAVVVTTPQEVSIVDVRKEVGFCRKVGLPLLGVVENMAGLRQPLVGVRFFQPPPPPAAGGAEPAAAANGAAGHAGHDGGGGEVDVTHRVLAALAAGGFADPGALQAAVEVFAPSGGGGAALCERLGLALLGRVPLDPRLGAAAEEGRPAFAGQEEGGGGLGGGGGPAAAALQRIVAAIRGLVEPANGGMQ